LITLTNTISMLRLDGAEAPKHVGAFVIIIIIIIIIIIMRTLVSAVMKLRTP